jgi:hypothetical protein
MNDYQDAIIRRAVWIALVGLTGAGVSLAAPPDHPAEATAHVVQAPAPTASVAPAETARAAAPSHSQSPAPTVAQTPAPTRTNENQGRTTAAEQHVDQRDRQGHAVGRRDNNGLNSSNGYYPLGYAYGYLNPTWSPYDGGPSYPGQFVQPDQTDSSPANNSIDTMPESPAVAPLTAVASSSTNAALSASPQWRDADLKVRVAQNQYDSAAARVMGKLRSDPAYQQALAFKERDADQLAVIQSKNSTPSIDRTAPVATAKLDAAQTITQLENQAIVADPQASAAKSDLDAAIAHRNEIGAAIEAALPKPAPAPSPNPAR